MKHNNIFILDKDIKIKQTYSLSQPNMTTGALPKGTYKVKATLNGETGIWVENIKTRNTYNIYDKDFLKKYYYIQSKKTKWQKFIKIFGY